MNASDISSRRSTRHAAALLFACAVGCGQSDNAGSGSDVNQRYQALAVQLQNCASNALDCLGAADCDETKQQACRDDFRACRAETWQAYRAFHQAVRECFVAKWQCLTDAGWGDAGADERAACREQLHSCVVDNRPIPGPAGPCMQGLRDCVQADAETGERPSHEQVHDCLSAAHQCVMDRLPMCGPDDMAGTGAAGTGTAGSGTAGTDAAGTGGAAGTDAAGNGAAGS